VLKNARMKMILATVIAAGCGASPTYGPPVPCGKPVSCPGSGCPSLDSELASGPCCSGGLCGYSQCGDWTIVEVGDNDGWRDFFKNGVFYARFVWPPEACVDGPASFAPPSCPSGDMKFPSCP
jgi:hypothetical protein